MSNGLKSKIFLEQAGYRQRRLRDALRFWPIFGCILLVIPLLWASEPADHALDTNALIYIFGVWVLLIAVTAIMARRLRVDDAPDPDFKP
ncbi:hypothetical protein [Yoonia sp. I 8.24]|uniref:hypothetical protein n=1 Tax=Yoonia sp. I 8.24 TaxID=1537229 RepID=UPI001EE062A7|nr:hypothetical protein [Yoonia sp. I 8.24]MCG3267341.1 hypothetical protein [Yoonia sp. I 8.24]